MPAPLENCLPADGGGARRERLASAGALLQAAALFRCADSAVEEGVDAVEDLDC